MRMIGRVRMTVFVTLVALVAGSTWTIYNTYMDRTTVAEERIVHEWPPFTMTYQTDHQVLGETYAEVRQFTYEDQDHWEERVIESEPFEIAQGTFSSLGSYQRQEGNRITTYDAVPNSYDVEIEEDPHVRNIPRGGMHPYPVYGFEEILGHELTPVTTNTRVCFEDVCTDNAPGWELQYGRMYVVLADDARGIPVKIGENFLEVIELRVDGPQEPVVRE